MNPGQFRHTTRIVINSETQDSDYGGYEPSSNTTYNRFCKIKWLLGNDKEEADTITLNKNVEFTYRYESMIDLIDQIDNIIYKNETFFIYSIEHKGYANQQLISIKARTYTD